MEKWLEYISLALIVLRRKKRFLLTEKLFSSKQTWPSITPIKQDGSMGANAVNKAAVNGCACVDRTKLFRTFALTPVTPIVFSLTPALLDQFECDLFMSLSLWPCISAPSLVDSILLLSLNTDCLFWKHHIGILRKEGRWEETPPKKKKIQMCAFVFMHASSCGSVAGKICPPLFSSCAHMRLCTHIIYRVLMCGHTYCISLLIWACCSGRSVGCWGWRRHKRKGYDSSSLAEVAATLKSPPGPQQHTHCGKW